jgi:hypothetical protein
MEVIIGPMIQAYAVKYPLIITILAGMGLFRTFLKPLLAFLKEFVLVTPSKKDDELIEKVEQSKVAKTILFILDWILSLKIVK